VQTSLTGLKGVFWKNALREVEGIGWSRIKYYFESQAEEFKFNTGILEQVNIFEQENVLGGSSIYEL
jgi:hypothetical protein